MAAQRPAGPRKSAAIRAGNARPILNIFGQDESAVSAVVGTVDLLSIQFREENKRKSAIHLGWRLGKDIAQPDLEVILLKPGGVIEARKREEFDFDFGNWTSRPGLAVR